MAAILRDPNPVHWDRDAAAAQGFGHWTINQGPLGLSYMVNMLHAWAGPGCITQLFMIFPLAVLDGDRSTAPGRVTAVREDAGERFADCGVRFACEGSAHPLEGRAMVCLADES